MATKRLARNYVVPQNREECDGMIKDLGIVRRDILRLEADMNDRLAAVKDEFEKKAQPLKEKAEELFSGIETWSEANRATLTSNNKVKFAEFGNGVIRWRLRPARVVIRSVDTVIESLKELGLTRFVRVKEEVNKDAILDDADAVRAVKGISIGSAGEDFAVEPFEKELTKEGA
jgi:phage host-nuclease inhibitor protein Gam